MGKLRNDELHKIQQTLMKEFTLGDPSNNKTNKNIIAITMRAIELYNQSLSDSEKQ